jgi:leader peptidase (prepilin peptidase)/N-methyltransferase
MRALLLVAAGLWGALWGSFFNVAITRFPWKEESVVRPASHCRSCQAPIAWYDNLPVLSWVILRGRCRRCKAPFSWMYPALEVASAGLMVALMHQAAPSSAALLAQPAATTLWQIAPALLRFVLAGALIVAGMIDLRTQLLPDVVTLPGIAAGLAASWWTGVPGLGGAALGAAVGAAIPLALHYGWKAVRGFEGMGLGDAKLLALVGAWLGWPAVVWALFAGSVQGIAGWMLARPRLEEASSEAEKARPPTQVPVPFGPFLALATLEWLLVGDRIWAWVARFVEGGAPTL